MTYAFRVGDHVTIAPEAMTRIGQSGVITLIDGDCAVVQHDDGTPVGYLLDHEELLIQETMPSLIAVATVTA